MDKELKKQLKAEHKCIHCQRPLPEGYEAESCRSCKKILKKAAADGGWRWKMTVQVLDAYGWQCVCCGETEPLFLTIDHIEGGGNLHREEVREHRNDWYKYLIENNFPEGFRTLCYNCNLGRSRNGGRCPHEEEDTSGL